MIVLRNRTATLKLLFVAIICGFLASFATGNINNDSGIVLPEIKYYGYPLAWLKTNLNGPTEYVPLNFALDTAFWIIISLVTLVFVEKIVFPSLGMSISRKSLLLPMVLFIPVGLVMDFIHESGHAIWGTAVGGTLTYMKIAYLEIYPRLAITSHFELGLTRVDGLSYGSAAYGLMLLGGSMTTNIASWALALILLKTGLGNKVHVALKVLGLFGILDLPFYIVFPQIGLGHWIFFGGCGPEPLIGARMMGVSDPAFYLAVALSTFGLVLIYSKNLRKEISTRIGTLLPRVEPKLRRHALFVKLHKALKSVVLPAPLGPKIKDLPSNVPLTSFKLVLDAPTTNVEDRDKRSYIQLVHRFFKKLPSVKFDYKGAGGGI